MAERFFAGIPEQIAARGNRFTAVMGKLRKKIAVDDNTIMALEFNGRAFGYSEVGSAAAVAAMESSKERPT
ncbi:MAG: hypothetical protein WC551_13900 [Patescibacteria group bacterium]